MTPMVQVAYRAFGKKMKPPLIVLAAILSLSMPAVAQSPLNSSDFSELEICNNHSGSVDIALFYEHSIERGHWYLDAWRTVNQNNCLRFGRIPKGYLYYFAQSRSLRWASDKRYICTAPRATFRRVFENEKCVAGENLVGMHERLVDQDRTTINLGGG